MAVYTFHYTLNDKQRADYEQASVPKLWPEYDTIERAQARADAAKKALVDGTFNPATDTYLPNTEERYGGPFFVRLLPETVGRVVSVTKEYTYYGDGMGVYSIKAIVVDDDGKPTTMRAGEGGEYTAHTHGTAVDAAEELFVAWEAWKAADKVRRDREQFNRDAYNIERGRLAYVSRGRKERGRSARIFWHGENRWGYSVGIEDDKGERFFTSANNVDVVPDPE